MKTEWGDEGDVALAAGRVEDEGDRGHGRLITSHSPVISQPSTSNH
jgi:hypothetical protein